MFFEYFNSKQELNMNSKPSYASTASSSVEDFNGIKSLKRNGSRVSPGKSKCVRFSTLVKVCLIPTRSELLNLSSSLYWTCNDCDQFKQEAFKEIKEFADSHECTVKQAIVLMYQPGRDSEAKFHLEFPTSPVFDKQSSIFSPHDKFSNGKSHYFIETHPDNCQTPSLLSPLITNINSWKTGKTDVELNSSVGSVNGSRGLPTIQPHHKHQYAWEMTWQNDTGPQDIALS
jgi:hypothetical protein